MQGSIAHKSADAWVAPTPTPIAPQHRRTHTPVDTQQIVANDISGVANSVTNDISGCFVGSLSPKKIPISPKQPLLAPLQRRCNNAPVFESPDISALRFKLQHVTKGLETVTCAMGQLSLTPPQLSLAPPQNLEPCPSEISAALLVNPSSRVIDDGGRHPQKRGAPLVIFSKRCLLHRVAQGAQVCVYMCVIYTTKFTQLHICVCLGIQRILTYGAQEHAGRLLALTYADVC